MNGVTIVASLLSRLKKRSTGTANYAYVTARVRAKKASLLPPETWPKLLARDSFEIARFLQENGYKDEVDALSSTYSGSRLVERATRDGLAARYREILSYCEGSLRTMVSLYLQRYDVYNVKTILRGKFSGASNEEITDALVPAGEITPAKFDAVIRGEKFDDVLASLADTPYGKVAAAAAKGKTLRNLVDIETAIDQEYFRLLVDALPANSRANRAFLNFIRREVDIMNLRTLFRLRAAGVAEFEQYMVPGGLEVKADRAARIVRAGNDELMTEIGNLAIGSRLEGGVREWLDTGNLNPAMLALDKTLIEESDDFSHRNPLSILPIIDYILRKRREVDNLRIIATGKETDLPEDVIKELIVA